MKQSRLHRPLLMFAALLVAALACMPGPAPTTAPTAAPPVQVQQTEPPAPVQTEAPPTPLPVQDYFTEEFDSDTGLWSHFVIDASIQQTSPGSLASRVSGDAGNMSVTMKDGALSFDLQSKGIWVYATYDGREYDDVHMTVVADNRGTNDNNVSLLCRYSEENGWYEFNIANSGLYDILYGKYTPDNKVVYSLIADGGSNRIKQGKATNTYEIACKGRTLVLTINGYETRRLDENDHVLQSGKVAVSVSSFNTLPVIVDIESVKIEQP